MATDSAKLALQAARNSRKALRCVQVVALLDRKSPIVEAAKQRGQEYHASRESSQAAVEMMGAPHHWIWAAVVLRLLDMELPEEVKSVPQQHAEAAAKSQELEEVVHVCEVNDTYDKEKHQARIVWSVAPAARRVALAKRLALAHLGAVIRYGAAPPSPLERQAQWLLTKMGELPEKSVR